MDKQFKDYITTPILFIVVLLALSFCVMIPVLDMILLGAILAFLIRPILHRIQNKIKHPSFSVILTIILVIIPLIILLAYILWVIVGVAYSFISTNPTSMDINQTITSILSYLHLEAYNQTITNSINSSLQGIGSYLVDYIVGIAQKLPTLSVDLFILLCSFFYFARDGDKAYKFVEELIPQSQKEFFRDTSTQIQNVLNSIFYGHFLTALILGIIGAIGYTILGYPYGIFLGILTGIFQLIPVIGPWPIYWALAIIDFIGGNYLRIIFVLLFGFAISLSDMYIRPALSSHYADVHPFILLIGFLAGSLVYGIVGFIIGPAILGITYAMLVSYKNRKQEE